jgi:hypothetical protein
MSEIETLQTATLSAKPLNEYVRWEVGFRAFNRMFETLAEAEAYCRRNDFLESEVYPVSIGYEAVRPGVRWIRTGDKTEVNHEPYFIFDFGKDAR